MDYVLYVMNKRLVCVQQGAIYGGLEAQNFLAEGVAALLEPATILDGTEEDAALSPCLALGTTAAALGTAAGGHGKCREGVAGREEGDELGIAISDGIAALLLRHDVVEALLRGGEEGFLAQGVAGYVGWTLWAGRGRRGRRGGLGMKFGLLIEPEAVEKVEETVRLCG